MYTYIYIFYIYMYIYNVSHATCVIIHISDCQNLVKSVRLQGLNPSRIAVVGPQRGGKHSQTERTSVVQKGEEGKLDVLKKCVPFELDM